MGSADSRQSASEPVYESPEELRDLLMESRAERDRYKATLERIARNPARADQVARAALQEARPDA